MREYSFKDRLGHTYRAILRKPRKPPYIFFITSDTSDEELRFQQELMDGWYRGFYLIPIDTIRLWNSRYDRFKKVFTVSNIALLIALLALLNDFHIL